VGDDVHEDADARRCGPPDMEARIASVAAHVTTPTAVLAFLAAAYDPVTMFVVGPQRGRWGAARKAVIAGWDDPEILRVAGEIAGELADQVIALAARFRGRPGNSFPLVIVGLSHLAVAAHAILRRLAELEARAAPPDGTAKSAEEHVPVPADGPESAPGSHGGGGAG
jgi:hypothetical protein